MNEAALRTLVGEADLFRDLDPITWDAITQAATHCVIPRATSLFTQGDEATNLFLVVEGRLKVGLVTADGAPLAVRFMEPGDLVGCAAVFRRVPYPATATAVVDTIEMSWTTRQIEVMIQSHPKMAANALAIMGGRAEEFLRRFREAATERVEQRIARTLLRLRRRSNADDRGQRFTLRMSRQDLAEFSGATLYTVSRTLSAWKREGIVEGGRGRITISDARKLIEVAHTP
ncbi:MAG TPA: Crp/Fnr family transcriptional regulator [Beijerinckiaceae bacterium]|nr:Crp/Fnr family transcriptional regulator [Beijerinckiaceae bacterium]